MATRAVVPQRQLRIRDEGKPKVVAAEGRTRRILKDIGNLVPDRAVEGKPGPQPTEKNKVTLVMSVTLFCVQGKNKNKRTIRLKSSRKLHLQRVIPQKVNVGVGKGGNVTKAAVTEQPKIVLSSVDERHIINIKDTKSRDKNKRSLSSTLTARSKAACGLTNKPLDSSVANIDEADANNELAVVEYIDEMYKFYKLAEDEIKVSDYMGAQPDLNAKMRSILIDWLIEVHRKFELMPETLYLAVNIVDRFLSLKTVPRKELQLVGISSMLIACKYEEIWAPEVNDFVSISANTYQREQILVMEKVILGRLEWLLTVPTPYVFLVRYVKASEPSDDEMENMVFFLAELGLMNYPIAISYSPSMIASAAVYAARCTLEKSPIWTATLHHHTGYVEEELKECAELLVNLHRGALDSKLKAVYRKYTSPDRRAVSLLPPAKSLTPDCSPEV
ncbi:G2/mitotic-specific cyclin S13-7 isoform X1 [Benincasa hispida]|uniref:G2/mitotic-specific cyclin S13-7 isoform X1 n=1 Tax=Benincasa hispida TaxID=102211 RepID=UPI0019017749|nr:G2/mitotic-specific cyclin S13-7 isoform X1 [Benincasa hispida]